jgi:Tfp pilus assembly pilus retraction ATPase PilT
MSKIHELLKFVVENHSSDLHMKVGTPPSVRVGGSSERSTGLP